MTRESRLTSRCDLVLASGGLDSSTLLAFALESGLQPHALFVDYGQPAATAEDSAVTTICRDLNVPLRKVTYRGSRFGAGEIRGRNAFLVHVALLEFPAAFGTVMLAIHAGTGFRDCGVDFIDVMQQSLNFHLGGRISITGPFVEWTKVDILRLAQRLPVPIDDTYSCEAGNAICGQCASCVDRRNITSDEGKPSDSLE